MIFTLIQVAGHCKLAFVIYSSLTARVLERISFIVYEVFKQRKAVLFTAIELENSLYTEVLSDGSIKYLSKEVVSSRFI